MPIKNEIDLLIIWYPFTHIRAFCMELVHQTPKGHKIGVRVIAPINIHFWNK